MGRHQRGYLLSAAVIVVGVLLLLNNLGWIPSDFFYRVAALWPVLLVIAGAQIVLNHTVDRRTATVFGLAIAALLVIGSVAYAAYGPAQPFGTQSTRASEPLSRLTAGTLNLDIGAATVEISQAALGSDMFQARVDYPANEQAPDISLDRESGTVDIHSGGSFFRFFSSGRRHVVARLNDRIPWALQIGGGAADIHLDVAELQLTRLEISGGASRLDAGLPKPKGTVPIDISGGASNITLRAPRGTAWRIQMSGGASSVDVPGSSFGSLGGELSRQSSGYDQATDRYTIQISGGASHISFQFE